EIDLPAASFAVKRGEVPRPSTCPRTDASSSFPRQRKTENFRLDEPALMTRIASAIASPHRPPCAGPACIGDQRRHGAGGEPRDQRVGAAGEDDRDLGSEHDARGVGTAEEGEAL